MDFLSLLALLFIGLKLTGIITWSWWLVTLPLWVGFAFLVALIFSGIIIDCFVDFFKLFFGGEEK